MKFKAHFLFILLGLAAFSSACWAPKEVAASREEAPTTSSPTTFSTPEPISKNTNMANKTNVTSDSNKSATPIKTGGFKANLPTGFQMPSDAVGLKLLTEYGAMCIAAGGASAPNKILFRDEAEVSFFQNTLQKSSETIGGFNIVLQTAAMDALKKAIAEARAAGKDITPRNADSASRSYKQTVDNWAERVTPGLAHWVSKGRLTQSEADRIKSLAPPDQVAEILKLEAQNIFFSKDLSKSILFSAAAPGASQHNFLLALDVKQFGDAQVREILARHGWFQTVQSDLPHFTYLGLSESELTAKGLISVTISGQKFWIPNI